jgi:hypothetical protein
LKKPFTKKGLVEWLKEGVGPEFTKYHKDFQRHWVNSSVSSLFNRKEIKLSWGLLCPINWTASATEKKKKDKGFSQDLPQQSLLRFLFLETEDLLEGSLGWQRTGCHLWEK